MVGDTDTDSLRKLVSNARKKGLEEEQIRKILEKHEVEPDKVDSLVSKPQKSQKMQKVLDILHNAKSHGVNPSKAKEILKKHGVPEKIIEKGVKNVYDDSLSSSSNPEENKQEPSSPQNDTDQAAQKEKVLALVKKAKKNNMSVKRTKMILEKNHVPEEMREETLEEVFGEEIKQEEKEKKSSALEYDPERKSLDVNTISITGAEASGKEYKIRGLEEIIHPPEQKSQDEIDREFKEEHKGPQLPSAEHAEHNKKGSFNPLAIHTHQENHISERQREVKQIESSVNAPAGLEKRVSMKDVPLHISEEVENQEPESSTFQRFTSLLFN